MVEIKKKINLIYSSSIDRLSDFNSSFDKGVLRIAYHGANRNNSYISKETFEQFAHTAHNCPIVANYNRDENEIGGHDIEIVSSSKGMRLINVTQPVGVVPETSQFWWEDVEESDGTVHEYLCTDIVLWKRQEAYSKIKDNGITDESMEITITDAHTEDGIVYIDGFEFTAFCLLERDKPCFESAGVEVFSLSDFKKEYSEMMNDLKNSFADISAFSSDSNIQNLSKGGNISLDKTQLLAEYGVSIEDLSFSIDELSLDELRSKLEEMKFGDEGGEGAGEGSGEESGSEGAGEGSGSEGSGDGSGEGSGEGSGDGSGGEGSDDDDDDDDDEPAEEDDGDDDTAKKKTYSLLNEQFMNQLIESLHTVEWNDPDWGTWHRYSYVDCDRNANEVYAYDMADNWRLFGFSYQMDGDNVVIDFDSKKRKKISIVDFDEGSADTKYDAAFNSIREKAFSFKDEVISEMKTEMESLKQFKLDRLTEDRRVALEQLSEQFSDLATIEAFSALMDDCKTNDMSIADIESKCFEIRGRNIKMNFSVNGTKKTTRTPVSHESYDDDEPYGGLFIKYGKGRQD